MRIYFTMSARGAHFQMTALVCTHTQVGTAAQKPNRWARAVSSVWYWMDCFKDRLTIGAIVHQSPMRDDLNVPMSSKNGPNRQIVEAPDIKH
jgi:hypothetical protein